MTVTIHHGDCIAVMKTLADNSVDAVVTDPPYELGFMGRKWDSTGIANNPVMWAEALRVLKPGGHLLAFGGTRTFHRMAVAIEDAGFDLRDAIGMPHESGAWGDCPWIGAWTYGSGFPKSLDVSKAIDKAAGVERVATGVEPRRPNPRAMSPGGDGQRATDASVRFDAPATELARQWQGWGTALKPAWEPIVMARKPLVGTVASNVLLHGTGAINIDGCRISGEPVKTFDRVQGDRPRDQYRTGTTEGPAELTDIGRWPANLILDGSDEVVALFPVTKSVGHTPAKRGKGAISTSGHAGQGGVNERHHGTGSAARFFAPFKAEPCQHIESLQSPARTAANFSGPPSEFDCSVLDRVVSTALPEGLRSSLRSPERSMNATPSELRLIATSVIATIQSFAPRFWREPLPERLSLTRGPVSIAISPTPTGTMTITASHWKSDGSVADATFDITPQSLEPGAKDSRQGLSSSRFMYCPKASRADRDDGLAGFAVGRTGGMQGTADGSMLTGAGNERTTSRANTHPTVKPTNLMRHLVRLVTPPVRDVDGKRVVPVVLDPFCGSGSTLKAADLEGFDAIGIDMTAEYVAIAAQRISPDSPLLRDVQIVRHAEPEPTPATETGDIHA